MTILSIQSFVTCGHVGNAAAVFCLQRTGHEVWPIDTVAYSNHPGHGSFAGRARPAAEVAEIVAGLERLGVLAACRAVLTGYVGSVATGRTTLAAAARVRRANPEALHCCDPVMGDREPGLYVPEDLVPFFRDEAVPAADIVMPNHFELELLAGRALPAGADILAAARALLAEGPRIVVVTSVATPDLDGGAIGNVVVTAGGAWLVSTPRLALHAKGAGDVLAALFLAAYLETNDAQTALEAAVAAVFAVVETTVEDAARELRLVAAQERMARPPRRFAARRLA